MAGSRRTTRSTAWPFGSWNTLPGSLERMRWDFSFLLEKIPQKSSEYHFCQFKKCIRKTFLNYCTNRFLGIRARSKGVSELPETCCRNVRLHKEGIQYVSYFPFRNLFLHFQFVYQAQRTSKALISTGKSLKPTCCRPRLKHRRFDLFCAARKVKFFEFKKKYEFLKCSANLYEFISTVFYLNHKIIVRGYHLILLILVSS